MGEGGGSKNSEKSKCSRILVLNDPSKTWSPIPKDCIFGVAVGSGVDMGRGGGWEGLMVCIHSSTRRYSMARPILIRHRSLSIWHNAVEEIPPLPLDLEKYRVAVSVSQCEAMQPLWASGQSIVNGERICSGHHVHQDNHISTLARRTMPHKTWP